MPVERTGRVDLRLRSRGDSIYIRNFKRTARSRSHARQFDGPGRAVFVLETLDTVPAGAAARAFTSQPHPGIDVKRGRSPLARAHRASFAFRRAPTPYPNDPRQRSAGSIHRSKGAGPARERANEQRRPLGIRSSAACDPYTPFTGLALSDSVDWRSNTAESARGVLEEGRLLSRAGLRVHGN